MLFHLKRVVLLCVAITLVAATPGCAISKKECLQGDWQTKGYKDGVDGKSPDILAKYADKCGKYGVTPDPSAYSAGFQVGIVLYCTAENGLEEGREDRDYSGACPANLEKGFLKSYVAGFRTALEDLSIEYDRNTLQLDSLRDKRDRIEAVGGSTTKVDKSIKYYSQSLISNTSSRSSINEKIGKWSNRL